VEVCERIRELRERKSKFRPNEREKEHNVLFKQVPGQAEDLNKSSTAIALNQLL